ncbi:uncharacterized protein N7479_007059 [Penicillium vulpinum]|uniref:uncharacterized protein n=1 Tax=Penicillium vulpinum TaxID=29845 RepID=UPI002547033D|nr:uncharacterized protein N7479_007059 [Penicillium vulpinum]KAJ5959909.1 hypothetical protein N7479_007059 [Penicillium vulpinum]
MFAATWYVPAARRSLRQDCVSSKNTPETPAMLSNEKEGKRVDSGSKLSWRCSSSLGLSWCITDRRPTAHFGGKRKVLGPTRLGPEKREMLTPRLTHAYISDSGFSHGFEIPPHIVDQDRPKEAGHTDGAPERAQAAK